MTSTCERTLDPAEVTVTRDLCGRDVIVIPDWIAAPMAREVYHEWREYRGQAIGESRDFPPGTWMFDTVVTILTVFKESPIPDGLSDYEHSHAKSDRFHAMSGVPAFIVGEHGWDLTARWWRNYETSQHLRVPHSPKLRSGGAYRFEG